MELEPSCSSDPKSDPINQNSEGNSILVSSLNTYTSEKTLREYFGKFGVVSGIKLEFKGCKNTGSALISYSLISDKDSLFLYDHFVDGSLLKITDSEVKTTAKRQTPKNPNEKTRSLMISGYIEGLKRSQIANHFGKYGKIIKYSDTTKTNRKRQDGYKFIFIKYAEYDDVDKVIGNLNCDHRSRSVNLI